MTATETLKSLLYGMGIIVSIPVAIALWRVAFHAGGIAKAIEDMGEDIKSTNTTMSEFAREVRDCLSEHGERIANIEGRWDGGERRHHERRTG